jgi:hypothetical protein
MRVQLGFLRRQKRQKQIPPLRCGMTTREAKTETKAETKTTVTTTATAATSAAAVAVERFSTDEGSALIAGLGFALTGFFVGFSVGVFAVVFAVVFVVLGVFGVDGEVFADVGVDFVKLFEEGFVGEVEGF